MIILDRLQKIKDTILNILFPKQCINCSKFGTYLCSYCKKEFLNYQTENICHVCKCDIFRVQKSSTHGGCSQYTNLRNVHVCMKYSELSEQLILEIKYKLHYDMVDTLVELMLETIDLSTFDNSILVPIPLHRYKKWKRGFNQAELIANSITKKCKVYGVKTEVLDLIKRNRNTKTQVGMHKEERHENLNNAFTIKKELLSSTIKSKKIILIDDVMTTGTTLEKCAEILSNNGVKEVDAIIFAR